MDDVASQFVLALIDWNLLTMKTVVISLPFTLVILALVCWADRAAYCVFKHCWHHQRLTRYQQFHVETMLLVCWVALAPSKAP